MTTLAQNREPSLRTRQPSSSNRPVARRDLQLALALARRHVLRRIERREVLPDDLLGRVALDSLRTGVPGCDTAIRIEHEDRVVPDAIDENLELLGRVTFRSLISESPFHLMCVEGDLDGRSKLTFVERLHKVTKGRRLLGAEDGFLIGVGGHVDHRHVEPIADDLGSLDAIHLSA